MSKGVQAAAGGKEPVEFEGLERWTSSANKLGDLTRSRQTSSEFMTPSKKRRISKGIKATGQDVFPAQVITDWVISNFGAPKFGQYSRMIANDCRRMKFYEVLTTSLRLLSMHCHYALRYVWTFWDPKDLESEQQFGGTRVTTAPVEEFSRMTWHWWFTSDSPKRCEEPVWYGNDGVRRHKANTWVVDLFILIHHVRSVCIISSCCPQRHGSRRIHLLDDTFEVSGPARRWVSWNIWNPVPTRNGHGSETAERLESLRNICNKHLVYGVPLWPRTSAVDSSALGTKARPPEALAFALDLPLLPETTLPMLSHLLLQVDLIGTAPFSGTPSVGK